jgi:16S rRNA (cytosine967-C5)-methyltransferase
VLQGCERGAPAAELLDRARARLDHRDSAFVLELVYSTLRNRAFLDWALDRFSAQPIARTDVWTRNVLRLGACQLLLLDRVPPSASVNTSTELAKTFGRKAGYVNGLLRTLDRSRERISSPASDDPLLRLAIVYSHPLWLVRRWTKRFGIDQTEAYLAANNGRAPLSLRVNRLRTTREVLAAALRDQGAETVPTAVSEDGLILTGAPLLRTLPAYQQGLFVVQDEAAQLIGRLVAPRPGETVLDACAAPGGKATHLAELMEDRGTVVALESDPLRLSRVRENCRRLGLSSIVPEQGDAAAWQGGPFDKVLIDAPCSGLGVLRRHPDGRWTKQESLIKERAGLQLRILAHCATLVQRGGVLVYATCSTEPEENEDVVRAFLQGTDGAFIVDDPRPHLPAPAARLVDGDGFFRTCPQAPEMDGFFGVRLARRS